MAEKKDIRTAVEERLAAKQLAKEFKDSSTGRVSGTRKESAAYKMILITDLDKIEQDNSAAIALVKKDKVFAKWDIPAQQELGVSAGAAFLKVKLRENYGSQPPNSSQKRKIYVGYVQVLINKFANVITVDEFQKVSADLLNDGFMDIVGIVYPEMADKILEEAEDIRARDRQIGDKIALLEIEREEKLQAIKKVFYETHVGATSLDFEEVPEKERSEFMKMDEDRNHLQGVRRLIKKEVPPTIVEFIKETFPEEQEGMLDALSYAGLRRITQDIFEDIFGKRFLTFITRGSNAVQETYEQAARYEPMSQEEADKKIAYARPYRYEKDKEHLETLEKSRTKESIEAFYKSNRGYIGYWNTDYSKHIYFKTIGDKYNGSARLMEWYREKDIEHLKGKVVESERLIEESLKKFKAHDNNWSWVDSRKGQGKEKRAELRINEGVPLAYIKRTGGYEILESDVAVNTIVEKFGFKTVTLGNYVKDSEAKEHIRHFLGAMSDLGEILNMDLVTLNSLNRSGKFAGLSLWFGAGGAGSNAAAWYRANGTVINLTKKQGDGTICHEYGHYLDNSLNYIGNSHYDVSQDKRIWGSVTMQDGYRRVPNIQNEVVRQSMKDIFGFINNFKLPEYFYKEPFKTEHKELFDKVALGGRPKMKVMIQASQSNYGLFDKNAGEEIGDYVKRFLARWSRYKSVPSTKKDRLIWGQIARMFGYQEYEFEFEVYTSAYYAHSNDMSSDYWSRDWELFARAFETYIFDKLEKAGRVNNYLVSGGNFDREEEVYPAGWEREFLYLLYDQLFQNIKKEYNIPDFVPIRTERSDEFVAIKANEDGEEETEAGVVVDEEDEVVETVGEDAPSLKDKFKMLAEMLSAPKMEYGGDIWWEEVTPSAGEYKYAKGGKIDNQARFSNENKKIIDVVYNAAIRGE